MSLKIREALLRGFFLRKTGETLRYWSSLTIKELDRFIGKIARYFISITTPIDNKQIMFITFQGDYTCNPKYITEQLLKENIPCNIVWSLRHYSILQNSLNPRIRTVEVNSPEFYHEIMRSKVIIANSVEFLKQPTYIKKNQILIETWHGSLGIKKFGKENNSGKSWVRAAKICGKQAKYIISNSDFEDNVYRTTFWPKTEILKFGHPRNDVFFNQAELTRAKEKIYSTFNISPEYNLFLYAPTFRDNKKFDCYNIDIETLREALIQKFGGNWIIAVRFHPTVRKMADSKSFFKKKNVINMTSYPDIQDIMLAADAAMTDYSSWIYDYILTKRPAFIYAPDINHYYNERGFYYSLFETPFPVAQSLEELHDNISTFSYDKYLKNVNNFLTEKGCIENGTASEKTVNLLKDIIK